MIRTTLIALLLTATASGSFAAPPSAESIERLLAITKTEALVESTSADFDAYLRQAMLDAMPGQATAAQKKVMDDFVPRMAALMREEFTWARLKPEVIRIYQESLDQAEVDGLLAFYETPVGQSTINKMPLIMQRTMVLTQEQMRQLMPKINQLMQDSMKNLAAGR